MYDTAKFQTVDVLGLEGSGGWMDQWLDYWPVLAFDSLLERK